MTCLGRQVICPHRNAVISSNPKPPSARSSALHANSCQSASSIQKDRRLGLSPRSFLQKSISRLIGIRFELSFCTRLCSWVFLACCSVFGENMPRDVFDGPTSVLRRSGRLPLIMNAIELKVLSMCSDLHSVGHHMENFLNLVSS